MEIEMTIQAHIDHLEAEVERLKMMLEPEDCGHLHTTINVLEHRIDELRKQRKELIFKEFASVMK